MTSSLDAFRYNITRVRELLGLHAALSSQTTCVVDLSDILRSLHVLCVSALDHYVHDVVRCGMMDIFDGRRPTTPQYAKFKLSIQSISGVPSIADARGNIEMDIRTQHSFLSFQKPEKIADAVRLYSEVDIWREVELKLGRPKKDIKDQLELIVDRRNKIAHEADLDPTYPNLRWPIYASDVEEVCAFIDELVSVVDNVTAMP